MVMIYDLTVNGNIIITVIVEPTYLSLDNHSDSGLFQIIFFVSRRTCKKSVSAAYLPQLVKRLTTNYFRQFSRSWSSGPVFTKILILRIVLFLEFFLEFCSFFRIIHRIRIFKIWNVLKSSQFGPI